MRLRQTWDRAWPATDIAGQSMDCERYALPLAAVASGRCNGERMPWISYVEARSGSLALYNDIVYAKLGVNVSPTRTFHGATIQATLGTRSGADVPDRCRRLRCGQSFLLERNCRLIIT